MNVVEEISCKAETNTTLKSNYPPIKNKQKIMIEDNLKRLIQKSEGMNEIENKNVTDDPQNQKACS